jgi:hypothetical protein
MKKLLLSATLFVAIINSGIAQITLPPFQTPVMTGAIVYPLMQGSAGTFAVEGVEIPKISGSFTSAAINAELLLSTADTYANDFTILITDSVDLATTTFLLQIGGYSNFAANKVDWTCVGNCDTDSIGAILDASAEFIAIDFTNNTNVIWILNGYINANPATNTGQWDIASLTFNGSLVSIQENVENAVSAVAYPNPATDVLNVKVDGDDVVSIQITAMDGKVVSTTLGAAANVAELTAGIYIYEAKTVSGAVIRNTFAKK